MSSNILITGGSGYLGGSLLYQLSQSDILKIGGTHKLFALVRTDAQAESVKQYGAEPLSFSVKEESAVRDAVLKHQINVVFYLIDPLKSENQMIFIRALAEVKKETGKEVHFLHTTGAKIFSQFAGAPTDQPLLDTDPDLYNIQKGQPAKAPVGLMKTAVETNSTIIEIGDAHGVRTYIFAPCIVYGKGQGFGNPISIQTVAIVKAARSAKKVYKVDQGRPTWPVSHIHDNTTLYLALLQSILTGGNPPHGKQGYYLASSGSVAWDDLYAAIAKAMFKRGIVDTGSIEQADEAGLEKMAAALKAPKELVAWQLGGLCTFTAARGSSIGWKPQYSAQHAVEAMDDEVELILAHL